MRFAAHLGHLRPSSGDYAEAAGPLHQIHRQPKGLLFSAYHDARTAEKMDELMDASTRVFPGSSCPLGSLSPEADGCGSVRAGSLVLG